jgi:hypothetical protein
LAAAVDEHEAQVRIHTESHRNVLRQFATHPHVLVRGGAGTGKTVLALEAAVQFASLGQRVLLACWNVMLAQWLRDALRDELRRSAVRLPTRSRPTPGQGRREPPRRPGSTHGTDEEPSDDLATWYHDTLPMQLTPATCGGEFDVVVLDEAQDLTELWVLAVAGLLSRDGRWYAFADGQQDLFHADAALPDFLEIEHELRENFRNSRPIAAFAADFGDVELDCVTGDGPDVRFVPVDGDEVVEHTEVVARRLQREERIAIRIWRCCGCSTTRTAARPTSSRGCARRRAGGDQQRLVQGHGAAGRRPRAGHRRDQGGPGRRGAPGHLHRRDPRAVAAGRRRRACPMMRGGQHVSASSGSMRRLVLLQLSSGPDAAAHRLLSDVSSLITGSHDHRLIVAGDLNILNRYGEHGDAYWAGRYASVFDRAETLGLVFVGPQAPHGRQADPRPVELPADSRDVPTYHTVRQGPAGATRQLDFVFASVGIADRVRVTALNEPDAWGPSDHCRIAIDLG